MCEGCLSVIFVLFLLSSSLVVSIIEFGVVLLVCNFCEKLHFCVCCGRVPEKLIDCRILVVAIDFSVILGGESIGFHF